MEIHAPEHPVRSLRDFAVHILTVTCGILIALGLEQLIQRHHDHELAAHARADFKAELAQNKSKVEAALASDKQIIPWLEAVMAMIDADLRHAKDKPPPPPAPETPTRTFLLLSSSAWDVGVATQAVNQLPFPEVRALSYAYNRQAVLNTLSGEARDQWLTMAGWQGDDTDHLSESETRTLLHGLRIADAYAHSLEGLETVVLEGYAKAEAALGR